MKTKQNIAYMKKTQRQKNVAHGVFRAINDAVVIARSVQ